MCSLRIAVRKLGVAGAVTGQIEKYAITKDFRRDATKITVIGAVLLVPASFQKWCYVRGAIDSPILQTERL